MGKSRHGEDKSLAQGLKGREGMTDLHPARLSPNPTLKTWRHSVSEWATEPASHALSGKEQVGVLSTPTPKQGPQQYPLTQMRCEWKDSCLLDQHLIPYRPPRGRSPQRSLSPIRMTPSQTPPAILCPHLSPGQN